MFSKKQNAQTINEAHCKRNLQDYTKDFANNFWTL